ncbi:MAG: hypothetical protein PHU25_18695 [Deltaproteobacteria bacterium]|nr:hypothetical protein [Deltaproteobacteria bacterium]
MILVACLITISRGFRVPYRYALAQWLSTYQYGFVKRGLVGTVFYPLLKNKNPAELDALILLFSTATLLLAAYLSIRICKEPLRKSLEQGNHSFPISVLVFATSAFWVVSGHSNGYFDHLLTIITVLLVFWTCHGYLWTIPIFCIMGMAIHELFILYGLPVVGFAALMALNHRFQGSAKIVVGKLALLFIPVLLSISILGYSSFNVDTNVIRKLEDHISSFSRDGDPRADIYFVTFQSVHSPSRHYQYQGRNSFLRRLARDDINGIVLPATVFLLGLSLAQLLRGRRFLPALAAVAVVGAPLGLHLYASDTVRITPFIILHAFGVWMTVVLIEGPMPLPLWLNRGLLFAGILVVVNSAIQRTPFMFDDVDKESTGYPRSADSYTAIVRMPEVFKNSKFESGSFQNWSVQGRAFGESPRKENVRAEKRPLKGREGVYYASSKTSPGNALTGILESVAFHVMAPKISFFVGGGGDIKKTYVSLVVEGKEEYRVSGRRSRNMRPVYIDVSPWIGRDARISIVDTSNDPEWGYISADGFCWTQ